jgi:hypothetical protein
MPTRNKHTEEKNNDQKTSPKPTQKTANKTPNSAKKRNEKPTKTPTKNHHRRPRHSIRKQNNHNPSLSTKNKPKTGLKNQKTETVIRKIFIPKQQKKQTLKKEV